MSDYSLLEMTAVSGWVVHALSPIALVTSTLNLVNFLLAFPSMFPFGQCP